MDWRTRKDTMSDEVNPIKDLLFDYIEKSNNITNLIVEKKFDILINEIIENCYDKIILMDKKEEAVGILATGILHYLQSKKSRLSRNGIRYCNSRHQNIRKRCQNDPFNFNSKIIRQKNN